MAKTIHSIIKSSSTQIFMVILILVNILFYIKYPITYQGKILFCTTQTSYKESNSHISHDDCSLSLKESDDWFCEFDDDWKRRKSLHDKQNKRNRNSDKITQFFINNWEPTIHCAFEQRIGSLGDGGKWVCDVYKLQTNNSKPLIYSLGSAGEFSFEHAIKGELPNAEIHTFDSSGYGCPDNLCTYHRATLGDGKRQGTKSLQTIMNELGHDQREIDILKLDIEGSEYLLFEAIFAHQQNISENITSKHNEDEIPYIRQILIEIHVDHELGKETAESAHRLFELFRSNNYAIFHKEPNLHVPNIATEYGFIRLNPAFFIS